VLVLQLKRFEYDMQLQKMTKVCADIDFPSSLDLSTFCSPASSASSNECVRSKEKSVLDDSVLWKVKKSIWDMSTRALLRDPSAFTALCNKITSSSTCEEASSGSSSSSSSSSTSAMYDLTGVVRHIGRTEGAGHYVCDVKLSALERRGNSSSAIEGIEEWRRYDDSLVTALNQVCCYVYPNRILIVSLLYLFCF